MKQTSLCYRSPTIRNFVVQAHTVPNLVSLFGVNVVSSISFFTQFVLNLILEFLYLFMYILRTNNLKYRHKQHSFGTKHTQTRLFFFIYVLLCINKCFYVYNLVGITTKL